MKSPSEMVQVPHEGLTRHHFTVESFFTLSRLGLIPERTELLEGDIYPLPPTSPRHRAAVHILADRLKDALRLRSTIFSQSTVAFALWSPLPDVVVLKYDPDSYVDRQPERDEVYLVVEVSDVTLEKDKGIKLRNYAREGILEYWIVNLVEDVLEVYRDPRGNDYGSKTTYGFTDAIAPLAFPNVQRVWLEPL